MADRSSGRQPGSGTGGGAVIAQRVPPRVRSGRAAPLSARRSASGPAGLLEGLRPRRPCPRHWGVPELPARGPGKVRDEETGGNGKMNLIYVISNGLTFGFNLLIHGLHVGEWNLPAHPKLCTSEMEKRHTCVGERVSGFCFVQSGSPLPSPRIPMCYKASCSQNRLGMKCHRLKLQEDGKTRCKLELSAGTQPLQPHPSAFPTGLGRI
ncbi:uncharacterized protein LOC121106543 [Gallus gallus]|uniref:uncharacterized protein LOC121106543 n=1 Tax=Gallus gallus TaxID=9031 RepID=UPI0003503F31|nr:uncharacterized protein LOC121106543 [Gallus gallus]